MTQAGDIGKLEGLMEGLKEAFSEQRREVRGDIKTIGESIDGLKGALHTETRKRIAADAAVEAKIPKPSTLGDKVEVNTTWRNRVIGGCLVLGGLAGWVILVIRVWPIK